MQIRKSKSIFRLFLAYLVGLSFAIITLLVLTVFSLSTAFRTGGLLSANYSEVKLNEVEHVLISDFDPELLPKYTSYIIVDKGYGVIDGNMSNNDKITTQNYLLTGTRSYNVAYKIVTLSNKNVLVVKYDVLARFSNPALNKIIPYPEITAVIFVFVFIILFTIITALSFSKKLKVNLLPIIEATEKIGMQNLDFEIKPSKISEINTSLEAIDKLKTALKESLHKGLNDKQQKKSALSALTHDIRTPLTVIKGNSELLLEDSLSEDTQELVSYIQSSSNTIEKYLDILMNLVNENTLTINKKETSIKKIIDAILDSAIPLCKTKEIKLQLENNTKSSIVTLDYELFTRAIMNIMDNAVRYSNRNAIIDLIIWENENYFIVEIIDFGKGFSAESLKKATLEFFTEDKARTGKNYGLGLSFTQKIADLHNGLLKISNTGQGAKVAIKIPLV